MKNYFSLNLYKKQFNELTIKEKIQVYNEINKKLDKDIENYAKQIKM